MMTAEQMRLQEITDDVFGWRRWGTYVADRSWGTVREDYSADGAVWDFLPHDLARSKTYRWGEDAIAGLCDRYQILIFAPAFWNGQDPILKERLFGVSPKQGNHGEDVKECYFYLDNTPTHAYMRFLYKYPQRAFPYERLVEENRRRSVVEPEFELLDTGVFEDGHYFDIFIEYAKLDAEDICIRLEMINRGPIAAPLHVLPHLWFRNTWCWDGQPHPQPIIRAGKTASSFVSLAADDAALEPVPNILAHYKLGPRVLYAPAGGELLFTDNETNGARVFGPRFVNRQPFVKDAFHRWLIHGEPCLNPQRQGTKAAAHHVFHIPPGGSVVLRLRLSDKSDLSDPLAVVDKAVSQRREEADAFYAGLAPAAASPDERNIQRQAFSGLLWNKQIYLFDVQKWQDGDCPGWPPPPGRKSIRNVHWRHLNSMRVLSVPDKWEFPWFAAWDLAFHCVPFALIDPDYAKNQLWWLLFEQFQHPNGQIPACEWEFSEINPPVHAWAVWQVFHLEKQRTGRGDRDFLERCFHKLLINFAWWTNKVDREGLNLFEGGFLGLDNITAFDRSLPYPNGAVLEQADGTGWMCMFCLSMLRITLELAGQNRVYETMAIKFFQHYVYIAAAMKNMGQRAYQLWDEDDGFFYDVLRFPDGHFHKFRVRSLVGLIPLFAVELLDPLEVQALGNFGANLDWFLKNRRDLVRDVVHRVPRDGKDWLVLTVLNQKQLHRILERLLDEKEFLSPYGIRSLSRYHESHPFRFDELEVGYEPAESVAKIKGGNSNWRGPIWFPTNYLLIQSLCELGRAFGDTFRPERPGHVGIGPTLLEIARDLANRLIEIFRADAAGRRPVHGAARQFSQDATWRDLLLFYEHFHGETGAGLGASHQTGWTALVASLIDQWRR